MNGLARAVSVALLSIGLIGSVAAAERSTSDFSRFARSGPIAAGPGQSRTLLPDGRWLFVGGTAEDKVSATIFTKADGAANAAKTADLTARLIHPRSAHTATVLPDGTVLILGGVDAAGATVTAAEILDPISGEITVINDSGLTPRSHHTATLLTDGYVLITGGLSVAGNQLQEAELWNPDTQRIEALSNTLLVPRANHSAALLADGKGLIWGGQDSSGQPLTNGEIYDPTSTGFSEVKPADPSLPPAGLQDAPPAMEASIPQANVTDAPVDARIAVRFSKYLQVSSVSAQSVTLVGPAGAVTGKVVGAGDGLLLFFTPQADLLPNASYTVFLRGLLDEQGAPLPWSAFKFTTRSLNASTSSGGGGTITINAPSSDGTDATQTTEEKRREQEKKKDDRKRDEKEQEKSAADDDFEDWIPGEHHRHGQWRVLGTRNEPRTNKALLRSAPLQAAMKSATAVTGRVARLNGLPLQGVTVRSGNVSAITDAQGRFVLAGVRAGVHEITIDGSGVTSGGRRYATHFMRVEVAAKRTTVLDQPIYLSRLNPANDIPIPSPADKDLVITHPDIPGLELHIPKGAVLRTRDGRIITKLNITPLPVDRVPFAVPEGFPVYFTIQPAGAFVDGSATGTAAGIRVIYPNYLDAPAGTRMTFWNYDPTGLGWQVYGRGTVSENGKQVIPDADVEQRNFMAFGYGLENGDAPPNAPPPGSDCKAGDPVSCATGLFLHEVTDFFIADTLPLALTRTYRPNDSRSRDFGIGTNHSYGVFLQNPTTQLTTPPVVNLILPDGARVGFSLISGTGLSNAVYQHLSSPTSWLGATLRINVAADQWEVTTREKTVYSFSAHTPNVFTGVRDRYGNSIQVKRATEGGNISQVRSTNGRALTFQYDVANRITSIRDNLGRVAKYEYDSQGRLWKATDPDGKFERYEYDSQHRMTSVIDKRGNTMVTNVYDANGRVSQQTLADGAIWGFSYVLNGAGDVATTTLTNPRNYVTQISFNDAGYPTQVIDAVGQPEQQTYNLVRDARSNLRLRLTDGLNRETRFVADYAGRITHVTRMYGTPEAVEAEFAYESTFSRLIRYTDPLDHQTEFAYDNIGSLTGVVNALGQSTTASYDAAGRLQTLTNALGKTTSLGYEQGDLASVTDPINRTSTVLTDTVGRMIGALDAAGKRHAREFDRMDRVVRSVDPRGGTSTMVYDENGNLLALRDARDLASHVFTYDERNRVTTYTDPLGATETYDYDAAGLLTSRLDRKGQLTSYTYDALDRAKTITYHDGSSVTVVWDAGNRPRQLIDSMNGTVVLDFDGLDRLTRESSPQGQVDYVYDDAGRRTLMTVTGRAPVAYTYDDANRLARIEQGSVAVELTYDAAGRRATVTLPNGTVGTYGFDDANQLLSLVYERAGSVVADVGYAYDDAGRRTAQTGSLAKMLIPSSVGSATYDAANRLTSWGSNPVAHDANGNVTAVGSATYSWNARDELTATSEGAGSFAYDVLGRRREKAVSGASTAYLHDGLNPVLVNNDQMLDGLGMDEIYGRVSASGVTSYVSDALGSTRMLTDSTGAETASYSYSAYGQTSKAGSDDTSFQFTGRENDGATNLHYFRTRYYSPTLQRFISEDRIGFAGGLNLYGYVGGDPVSFADPTGELPFVIPVITGGIGAVSGALGYAAGRFANGCDVELGDLALAFGAGFVQGALTPYLGFTANIVVGGAINVAQSYLGDPDPMSGREMARSFTTGALGTFIGGRYGRVKPYPFDHSTKAPRDWVDRSNAFRDMRRNVGGASFGRDVASDAFEGATDEGADPCMCN